MSEFKYQEPFPMSEDTTEYRLLTKDYVSVEECCGRKILKVAPEGLNLLAREAFRDVSFYLRASHLQMLANILEDPEASDNDKFVAYTMLLNQAVAADGELPTCQDTGKAKTYIPAPTMPNGSRKGCTKLTATATCVTRRWCLSR